MADTTTNLQQAQSAYQAALAALGLVHKQQDALIAASPIDWTAYNAALSAATSAQGTAQAAITVYQSAILNSADVATLLTQLQSDTAALTANAKALQATAASLTALASAADTTTQVLTAIAKFVPV